MSENRKLTVSDAPFTKGPATVTGIMLDVIIALIPAAFAGVAIFGFRAAVVIALCVASCVLFEYGIRILMKKPVSVGDLSAAVTGLILAFNLPVTIPLWMCVAASAAAIALKQLSGGIGKNHLNPANTARILLLLLFAPSMTHFTAPMKSAVDTVSAATPISFLNAIDLSGNIDMQMGSLIAKGNIPAALNMLFGVRAGCIGEVCSIALIIGGIYLVLRGIISITIPAVFISSTTLFMLIVSGFNGLFTIYELLGGGLLLGAFFMATDFSTRPVNFTGKLIFGAGCGIITSVLRLFTPLPEGVAYAILIMNIFTLLIEKVTAPKYFGYVKPQIMKADTLTEVITEEAPEVISEEAPEIIAEEAPEEITEEAPEVITEEAPEVITEEAPEEITEEAPEVITEEAPEVITEEAPEVIAEEAPEVIAEEAPEVIAEAAKPVISLIDEIKDDEPAFTPSSRQKSRLHKEPRVQKEKKEKPAKTAKPAKLAKPAKPAKTKTVPDFSEPLPDVIPAFLVKDLGKVSKENKE